MHVARTFSLHTAKPPRFPALVVQKYGQTVRYDLLAELSFESSRARMGVLIRRPDGSNVLYVKGADNIIKSTRSVGVFRFRVTSLTPSPLILRSARQDRCQRTTRESDR